MQVKQLKDEDLNKQFEVTIPSTDIDQKIDGKLQEYGRTIHLKGFRPGKAPLKVLRQHYGRRVMGEILEQAVNESSRQLMDDKNLKPAKQPKIEVINFDDGQDLVYSIEVEQIPDFELQDISGLKVEKPVAEIREDEVDQTLESVAKHHKSFTPLEEKRAAKEGDAIKMDFEGELADGTKYPGMESTDFELELGSGQFIPGFEEQLIGKKPGEDAEVRVTFPEEYQVGELAGKEAIFKVKVKELLKAEEMKISDELAQKVGFDNLEILKESIRNKLQSEYEQMSNMKLKRNILDKLDEMYDFQLPEGLVESEYDSILNQVEQEKHQHDHDHDHGHDHDHDHDHSHDISDEEKTELKEIAKRRVKLGLVLAELGRENAIEVGQNEIQDAVMKEAQKYPGHEQQVIQYYTQSPQAIEAVRAPLFEEKVLEHILDMADIKENVVTPEELASEDDEENSEAPASESKETGKAAKGQAEKKAPAKKTAAKKSETQKKAAAKTETEQETKEAKSEKKPAAKKKAPAKKSGTAEK